VFVNLAQASARTTEANYENGAINLVNQSVRSMVSQSGRYLGLPADTLGLGVNLFAPQTCTAVGTVTLISK
jgi:phospholipase/lecithinase/hemolysin